MTNNSKPVWITVAVVIAIGLMFDAARRNNVGEWHPRLAAFGMGGTDDGSNTILSERSPRSSSATRARSRLYKARLAGLDLDKKSNSASPESESSTVTPTATTPTAATPAAGATKPETKKAEDRKKKKKKKKKKSTLPGAPASEKNESDDVDEKSDSDAQGASGSNAAADGFAGGGTAAPIQPMTGEPKTLEEWLAYVLREPNYEHTMKLITQYQVREIGADIFYGVVQEMLNDSRAKMHEYAVMALGSAPSTKSFGLLQIAIASEHEGSELRLQARNYLKTYSRMEYLKYLISIVTSETAEDTRYEALRMIRLSAEQNLKSTTRPSTSGNGSTGGSGSVSVTTTRQFNPLVPILTRLIQTSNDQNVRNEATSTLQRIQSLLGTTVAANG